MKDKFTQMNSFFRKTALSVGLCAIPIFTVAQTDWSYLCNACDATGVGYNDISGQTLVGDLQWRGYKSGSKYVRFTVNNVPDEGTYDMTVYYAQADTRYFLITVSQGDKKEKMYTVLRGKNTGTWEAIGSSILPVRLFKGDNTIDISAFGTVGDVRNLLEGKSDVIWGPNLNKIELKKSAAVLENYSVLRELEDASGESGTQKKATCNSFTHEIGEAEYISEGLVYSADVDFGHGVDQVTVHCSQPRASQIHIYIDGMVDETGKKLVGGTLVKTLKVSENTADYTATLASNISGIRSLALVCEPDNDTDGVAVVDKLTFFGTYQSLDDAGDRPIVYNVGIEKAGTYMIEFDYATMDNRSFDLSVNGGEKVNISCNVHTSAWDKCEKTCYYIVDMAEGSNKFQLYKNGNSPNLDKMRLTYLSEPKHELVSLDYTMTDAGWGTLMVPFGYIMPKTLTLYTCGEVDADGVLQLEEVERDYEMKGSFFQYVQANTPYIVSGAPGAYVNFTGMAILEDKTYQNGCLVGTCKETVAPEGSYVLQNQSGNGAGFYQVGEGGKTVKAFRAYMVLPEGGNVNLRTLVFPGEGDVTGIKDVSDDEGADIVDVYHINGMPVRRNVKRSAALDGLQKGIYIVGGVKRVIK